MSTKHILTDLRLSEVSLVPKPGNQHARVLLCKSEDQPMKVSDLFRRIFKAKDEQEVNGLLDELDALEKSDDPNHKDNDMSETVLKQLQEGIVALTKSVSALATDVAVMKFSPEEKAFLEQLEEHEQSKFKSMDGEARKAYMMKAKGVKKSDDAIAKADVDAIVQAAVAKALEPVTAIIADQQKVIKSQVEAAELETITKELRNAGVPGAVEKAKVLQNLPAETAATLKKTFLAEGALIAKSGMFDELGVNGSGGGGESAYGQLNRLANERMSNVAKSGGENITFQKAFDQVYTDPANRELVARYKAEQRSRSN